MFITEAVLQRLERAVFAAIFPKLWKRYANNTFVIINQDNLSAFHQLLNPRLPGIRFTMKTAAENKPPFLDVLVHNLSSGTFETSVFRKATNADLVLHYDSNSPPNRTLVNRTIGEYNSPSPDVAQTSLTFL